MVEVALFNIKDMSLFLSGVLALALACLLFFSRQEPIKPVYWCLVALFFFLGTLCTIDTLLYWNIHVRDALAVVLMCVSLIVVYLLKNANNFSAIETEHSAVPEPSPEEPQQQLVEKLTEFMQHNKPYLEPHITVERLAIKLNVSPKLLSCTINSKMQMNFFELISTYRVAEAKKRLADAELRQKPISEIMKSCGFNSKSVFNQAFKKTVGVTPSLYRQQHLPE